MGVVYKQKFIHRQYDLAKLVGKKNVVMHGQNDHLRGACCLCAVDFERTAVNFGCRVDYESYGSTSVEFVPLGE
jgi:hypothetical protein